ncbi:MAG: S41 family peptidase [Acidobacteriota bacterium]
MLAPLALACILTAACGAGLESEPAADWWSVSQGSPEELRGTVWANPGTSHWLKWREDGSYAVYHRLGEDCFADTGVVPEYALARPVGEALETAYYDYRNWPQLLQLSQRFERRKELPPVCLKLPRVWEFGELYELVVRAFDQHYAFFAERGVDWSARRKLFEERGRGVSSGDELFSVLEEMLGDFGDGHLNLRLGERSFNAGRPKLRQRLAEHWQRSPRENTESEFVASWHRGVLASVGDLIDGGALRTGAAGALEWGSLGEVGYVRVVRFGGFTEEALSRPEQYAAFEEALKTMKSELESAQAFVVDVALNGGGSDAAALLATSFFADERRPAIAYEEAGSPRRTVFVEPVGKEERPVLLLTSEVTASAAECFAVMMRSLPHVVHVGGTTRGGLSSLLPKPLPEGLLVTLSYQRVLDPSGRSFEGVGVIPDVEVELFPNEDLRGTLAKTLAAMASDPSEWIARAATTPR